MDEQNMQQPAPETVPARRKSGRMRGWKASILACVICILVTALVTSLIFVGKFGGSRNYKLALKFAQVKQVVDKNYIGDADDTAISDAASSAIISAIGDKWSYYMTAEEYKAYQMYSNNEYAGIGVSIQLDDKTKGFRITAVTYESPAANAGLKQGEIILSIDGEDVTGKTLSEVQTIIRAKLNKTLKLTNVLSHEVQPTEMGNMQLVLTQMQNFMKSNGAQPIGPLVQAITFTPDHQMKLILMQQATQFIPQMEQGYHMDAVLRVKNCLYAHYCGPMSQSQLAASKLQIHAFENEQTLTGDTYTIFVRQDDDDAVVDVFMEIK